MWTRFKRALRFNYLKVLRLKTSAHSIALGCALGLFIGFMPIIPFQTAAVIVFGFLLRANKVAAFLCTFISNVANIIPFYAMLYYVGSHVIPPGLGIEGREFGELTTYFRSIFNPETLDYHALLKQGWEFFLVMVVGGVALGIPSSIAMYFLSLRMVLLYRRRKAMRRLRKAESYTRQNSGGANE